MLMGRHRLHGWAAPALLAGLLLAMATGFAGCATAPPPAQARFSTVAEIRHHGRAVPAGLLLDRLGAADTVFVGEIHDSAPGHRFELELLQALAQRGRPVVLALEMFERDVQPALDAYLSGETDEATMLRQARPWSNYAADYRPLVEFARARGWPVVASNAPRQIAAEVSRSGLAALASLPPGRRDWTARSVDCPAGRYRAKFFEELGQGEGHGGRALSDQRLRRLFESQCLKDETMAETVVARLSPGALVVHLNGAFHTDQRLGLAAAVVRRRPSARLMVISVKPQDEIAPPDLADFVVFTARPSG
jgi:uncharacterized iron-regulated protein